MNLIDSYGWIEYFSDGPLAKKYAPHVEAANEDNTITPTVVLYGVYRKLKKEKGEDLALEAYAEMTRTRILPLDQAAALTAADTSLRNGLSMADAIVYSTAKSHRAQLLTSDIHLKDLEDVKFVE